MDKWAEWLLKKRFGGNEEIYKKTMEFMGAIRDRVLEAAEIKEGDTVLDVGCGDGLLAMGALEKVGANGKVIFSDVSESCIEHCKQFATGNCEFIVAGVEDLSAIPDASVDAAVIRSVLIYVDDKEKAMSEIYRVLKPGGRFSFFEPINSFSAQDKPTDKMTMLGVDLSHIPEIYHKIKAYKDSERSVNTPMLDFDERNLLTKVKDAGFAKVKMIYEAQIDSTYHQPPYDSILHSVPNPNAMSLHEILDKALTAEERSVFEDFVRPRMHLTPVTMRQALAYVSAVK
ncbi:MAG TPA: methyltransferase domain-containing protein [Candidatus Kapabacteria bacterium]|nr:methyltransferase domain-containing protein [Candidatus Kapabacteria bacterium]